MKDKVIVALDTVSKEEALNLVENLSPLVRIFKIGSVPFTSFGPKIIEEIRARGCRVFLDLKFHDIPKVVGGAVGKAGELGVEMMTIHILGGEQMLKAAVRAAREIKPRPKILGVTILTSLEDRDLEKTGIKEKCAQEVKRLALLAMECDLDGVVTGATEVKMLREILPSKKLIVTPGIRPEGGETSDQKRTMTPSKAIKAGSDYLVIGRPITQARDPRKAVEEIIIDINE